MKHPKSRAFLWLLLAVFGGAVAIAFIRWAEFNPAGDMLRFIAAMEIAAVVGCLVTGVKLLLFTPTPAEQLPRVVPRHTVAVDFDGVLHSYISPWVDTDVIPDDPVPGAIEWLWEISKDFDVVVLTTRGRNLKGRNAVRAWLVKHGYDGPVKVTDRKVPALVYIDDRAVRFDGLNFPSKGDVHQLRPWNKPRATKVPA